MWLSNFSLPWSMAAFFRSALIKDLSALQVLVGTTQLSFSHTCLLYRELRKGGDGSCVCHLNLSFGRWRRRMPYGLEDSSKLFASWEKMGDIPLPKPSAPYSSHTCSQFKMHRVPRVQHKAAKMGGRGRE